MILSILFLRRLIARHTRRETPAVVAVQGLERSFFERKVDEECCSGPVVSLTVYSLVCRRVYCL